MPRIPDQLQKSIAFVYPSAAAARQGDRVGGTAFFVDWPDPSANRSRHVVTNSHVVRQGGTNLRINTRDGGTDLFDVPADQWVHHPDDDDVAVANIAEPQPDWDIAALDWNAFVGPIDAYRQRLSELHVGVGDEVIMLGRFVAHSGRQQNQPLARFGNIAMMPGERVIDGRGLRVEAYMAEMRSLAGFSGSPVFVYLGPGTYRGSADGRMMPFYSETIGLIGIDTGHKLDHVPVLYRDTGETVDEGWEVRHNTGVSIVAPVWKIADVLTEMAHGNQRDNSREKSDDSHTPGLLRGGPT